MSKSVHRVRLHDETADEKGRKSGSRQRHHARRMFVEGEKTAPETARAAVDLIGQLFAREKQAKDVSVAERLALRRS
jgi:hypothetical protein